jgi:ABC-type polysaccharide/polyol phosphate transport system ATPase subunit
MTYAVRVEGLGKRYTIDQGRAATTLRETLTRGIGSLFGRASPARHVDGTGPSSPEANGRQFWALKDVTFDVAEGERIGVIGANGAGKSTLLKLLSRVTAPTEGSIEIRGKVASLLEVGTGFHPELSGRENVFLNGTILGMTTAEIRKKFDRIVGFSGVEKFIDTPVKYYSSGMYVRLAFSIAAWLEPDILIVDEVLAVGDMAFQRKCFERIRELTGEGRTILFVSHSMSSVNQMCQKALVLNKGRIVTFAPVEEAILRYEKCADESGGDSSLPPRRTGIENPLSRGGTGEVRIRALRLKGAEDGSMPAIASGGALECEIDYGPTQTDAVGALVDVGIAIDSVAGTRIYTYVSGWQDHHAPVEQSGGTTTVTVRDLVLRPGTYFISLSLIHAGTTCDSITHCSAFRIVGAGEAGGIGWQADFGSVRFPTSFSNGTR